ncbi:acyltransferase family protein [Chiayiivirga flava]|uniref:Peptidoglycan/LPS O-acetylase OafA/YrhL n=1 Tax=Chiayiivirga flava TaxID=659595 RepID=A0A7W8D826_9GAMM|nr:acyltransferase [Chiayiivirga flava]MBB5209322.1 peptidoglycan/LPS O-acetylase OafA/YrhL [Chiayiivirga flava]
MHAAAPLADASGTRDDNFLALRHLAAVLVIYGHSYALAFNPRGDADVIARTMPGFHAGNLAVHLFFAISGYLVTLSLLRHPGVLRYTRHRVLRVYPAYFVCLLLCVFALGPAFTSLPLGTYLGAAGTWDYLGQNLLPITFAWSLPGVFEHNPIPHTVNGTLWSLGLEVRWYFYLGVLAALGVVRRRWAFTLLAGAVLALGAWEWWSGKPDPLGYRALSQIFLLAALAAHWREAIACSHRAMAVLVLLAVLLHGTRGFGPAVMLAALHFCLWFAYRLPPLRWPRTADWSYGLFLYGFPVQQMLMAWIPTLSPPVLFVAATVVTLPLAMLSWRWVERPALRLKRNGNPARAPEPAV